MLLLLLSFLADKLESRHMSGCKEISQDMGEVFRLDAAAKGQEVCVGGWLSAGGRPTKQAPWFSIELTRVNAPWAFARGEPFRTIASLELLGSLLSVMVLLPVDTFDRSAPSSGLVTIGGFTDNQGNAFLVDKLMTTKYPLGVVLVELCHQLQLRNASLRAQWVPRLQNEEADALTNGDFRHFDLERRVEVDLERLPFGVLPALFDQGEAFVAEVAAMKAAAKAAPAEHAAKRKRLAGGTLRERQPWT